MRIAGLYRREVVTAELADSVTKAAKRMRLHDVSALPVVDHARIVGIVSERDITRAVAQDQDVRTTTVADVMTHHPLEATPDDEPGIAAVRMLQHGIRHLPVVEGHRLLGVISARDLLALEAGQLPLQDRRT